MVLNAYQAWVAQKQLSSGKVAYVGTGEHISGHCLQTLILMGNINVSHPMSSLGIS